MNGIDFNSLIPLLESVAGGAIGAGVLKGPVTTLNDWWYVHFGANTDLARKKKEILNQSKIEAYKRDIFNEVKDIPAKNIKEPQLDIIGPALEASKYYIDEPELRKMFAKLVASSMDASSSHVTRSAFVEFVKQMNPVDAQLLSYLSKKGQAPLGRIDNHFANNKGYNILFSSLLSNDVPISSDLRAGLPSAIQNLARLSLVETTYSEFVVDLDYENLFKKTTEYSDIETKQTMDKKSFQDIINQFEKHPSSVSIEQNGIDNLKKLVTANLEIARGLIRMTTLGKDFASICL